MAQEEAQPQQPTGLSVIGGEISVDDGTMEDLIEKLKLLRYETAFCPLVKPPFKPLSKYYFSGPSTIDNPNAQFYYFTSLCSWLMGLSGHNFEPPGQFDDPNATSTNILSELRAMNISAPNLAPNRIRQGSGEAVLTILSVLADHSLLKKGFSVRAIDYSNVEKYDELDGVTDGDDDTGIGEEVEDNVMIESDDEDEVYVRATGDKSAKEETGIPVESGINAEEWNLEVERVGPLLQVRSEGIQDWRTRIESATVLLKAVEKMYPEVRQMLQRLGDDLEKSKDRIQKREQTLAQQFSDQVEDYRVKLRELNTSQDAANVANQSVQQLLAELNQVTGLLDQVKRDIEDREAKISDTTPLMQVKDAVMKVRAEIKQMSLRIGVLQHTVLHYVMKQTKAKRERSGHGLGLDDWEDMESM
ncbi:putative intraflagellar transport protein 57 [Trypanosoma grayi]|uniref:putative intraflagellar transport protein 57 n=1 Tax=Trypanosoma grayi TaxID=71804 RepID=UPI0004F4AFBB|nr:putative intraflagellar transport protein 57 [Trypanosoma grayi]KEG15285.1 putative intraflagellar transport protein 57 [Trypanosoma grayi]